MKSCYLIESGVTVMATEGCSTFKPHTTKQQLQFDRLVSRTASEMTFAKDNWLIRAPLEKVTYYEWDATGGQYYCGNEIPSKLDSVDG